ncbi:hypothetical protein PROFUN_16121 [Planoprotostelium fungivorum]|uniref:Uncharacterized protein n=1 Tax=Planoprotostelium fungivorum TaxID=1890364 RepID=A0A2P6MSM2_9EUKA|nr:hypothetical protein PROFUN_16121 [Planoprotostelium fungivorum]
MASWCCALCTVAIHPDRQHLYYNEAGAPPRSKKERPPSDYHLLVWEHDCVFFVFWDNTENSFIFWFKIGVTLQWTYMQAQLGHHSRRHWAHQGTHPFLSRDNSESITTNQKIWSSC